MHGQSLPGVPGKGEDHRDVLASLVEIGHHAEGAKGDGSRRQKGGEQGETFASGGEAKAAVAAEQRHDENRAELEDVRQVRRLENEEEQREQDAKRGGVPKKPVEWPFASHPAREVD